MNEKSVLTTILTPVPPETKLKAKKDKKRHKWMPFKCHFTNCDQRFDDLVLMRNHFKTHINFEYLKIRPKSRSESSTSFGSNSGINSSTNNKSKIFASKPKSTPKERPKHLLSDEWLTTDIEVRVIEEKYCGQEGVIRSIYRTTSGNICTVFLAKENSDVNLFANKLEPIIPKTDDRLKVILGNDRQMTGSLINIDDQFNDGFVRFDSSEELKVLPLIQLCKAVQMCPLIRSV